MEFSAISKLDNGCLIAEVSAPEADRNTQYAYYLYEKERGLLEKRWYAAPNTCAFQLSESGTYYVKAYIRQKTGSKDAPSVASRFTNTVIYYPTRHLRYETLEQEGFQSEGGCCYDILWNGVHYEFFIRNRRDSRQAVVLGTGDVGQHKRPYFARISWANDLPGTAIYYSDPTSYKAPCTLGWGYGTSGRWYLEDIAILLYKILARLGVKPENTLFFGSSGGGFTSLLLAAMLHGRATVINPQFSIEAYVPQSVALLKRTWLTDGAPLLPERAEALALFRREAWFPPVHIVQNIRARRDMSTQLLPFLNALCHDSMDCSSRLRVDFYADEGGHGAMPPKDESLRQMAEDLARPLPPAPKDAPCSDSFLSRFFAVLSGAE